MRERQFCTQHAERGVDARCELCERPFCADCLVDCADRRLCALCKVSALDPAAAIRLPDPPHRPLNDKAKNAFITACVSLFCCGLILAPIAFAVAWGARVELRANPAQRGYALANVAMALATVKALFSFFTFASCF